MGRPSKPPRIWQRTPTQWLILDKGKQYPAGKSHEEAVDSLTAYIRRGTTAKPRDITVGAILDAYLHTRSKTAANPENIRYSVQALKQWWAHRIYTEVNEDTCLEYAAWRSKPYKSKDGRILTAGPATIKKDLGYLGASLKYALRKGTIPAAPAVTLIGEIPVRDRWLTRDEAARLLRAASPHVRRFILLALGTGSRRSAILRLLWRPSPGAGWIDTASGQCRRAGPQERATKKRRGPVKLPTRLLSHCKRWEKNDLNAGIYNVIHYDLTGVNSIRTAFDAACERAGLEGVSPHTLKHTAVTWFFKSGGTIEDAVEFFDTTADTLLRVYRAHSPDNQQRAASIMDKGGK